ncbi:hypothetical protein ACQ4LE_010562 [Meloidogyne hapla]
MFSSAKILFFIFSTIILFQLINCDDYHQICRGKCSGGLSCSQRPDFPFYWCTSAKCSGYKGNCAKDSGCCHPFKCGNENKCLDCADFRKKCSKDNDCCPDFQCGYNPGVSKLLCLKRAVKDCTKNEDCWSNSCEIKNKGDPRKGIPPSGYCTN